jgi:Lipid A 3-O-deacylase (PagL)
VVFFLLAFWELPIFAFGQADPAPAETRSGSTGLPLTRGTNQFGFWGGYSPKSFVFEGTSQDRKLFLLNLQYSRVLFAARPLTLKYTTEVVPVALETQPSEFFVSRGELEFDPGGTAYGAGVSPVGFQVNFGPKKVQPFLNGSVGLLYFNRQVPLRDSSQFNFTYTGGAGVEIFVRPGRSLTLGWKYHHLSNAETGTLNPGIDSGVFYAGFSWFRRK